MQSACKKWPRTLRRRETGLVRRSSKNGNLVTKDGTLILKMERGILKKKLFPKEWVPAKHDQSRLATSN